VASKQSSHAEGTQTIASGNESHAEGQITVASGTAAHAEGQGTTAAGPYDHAEGFGSMADGTAGGGQAHAEGHFTQATGGDSHAQNDTTIASGEDSHAQGHGSQANGDSSSSAGRYSYAGGVAYQANAAEMRAAVGDSQHVQVPLPPRTGAGTVVPPYWPLNRTMRVTGHVVAREDTGADHSFWDLSALIKTDNAGAPTDLTAATVTHVFGSGTSPWTLTFVNGTLTFALGGDGRTIHWLGTLEWTELG
jgi:hypothetical protein